MNKKLSTVKGKRLLTSFSVFDLIIIAMCAGLGIAVKPVIVPLVHVITGPLFIPGGAVAGGLYMMFIVIAEGLTGKRGSATLACAVQVILVLVTGITGSQGIFSVITYLMPGIMVDLLLLIIRHKGCCVLCCFFSGLLANLTGTFLTNIVFFRLPIIPLMLVLLSSAFSGSIGGLAAWGIVKKLKAMFPAFADGNPLERGNHEK